MGLGTQDEDEHVACGRLLTQSLIKSTKLIGHPEDNNFTKASKTIVENVVYF